MVAVEGIETEVRALLQRKAAFPMNLTPGEMMAEVREGQELKAPTPMVCTVEGI